MRVALVANPDSGRGLGGAELSRCLERHGAEVVVCERPWTADGARAVLESGADRVVAAGGDGTIGACAELAGRLDVPLAVVAAGTANDFARDQALPREPEDACELAVHGRRLRALELAHAGDRPFVNAAAAGLSPLAARRAAPLKPALGPVAYFAGALAAGLTARRLPCRVQVDGRTVFDGGAWQVIVAATGAFGAGSDVEEADPRDGRLDVVVIGGSRLVLPYRAWGMRRASIARQPGVVHVRGDGVEMTLPAEAELNVDGEVVADHGGRLRFEARRAAFRLVVPDPA